MKWNILINNNINDKLRDNWYIYNHCVYSASPQMVYQWTHFQQHAVLHEAALKTW